MNIFHHSQSSKSCFDQVTTVFIKNGKRQQILTLEELQPDNEYVEFMIQKCLEWLKKIVARVFPISGHIFAALKQTGIFSGISPEGDRALNYQQSS